MSLLQQINEDRKDARRDGNNVLAQILTTLLGEANMPGFNDGKRDSTDAEVIKVVTKFRNAAQENSALSGLSEEQRGVFTHELAIYNQYLPKQLTEVEMADIIAAQFVISTDKTLKGKVMGYFKTNYPGKYDGRTLGACLDVMVLASQSPPN